MVSRYRKVFLHAFAILLIASCSLLLLFKPSIQGLISSPDRAKVQKEAFLQLWDKREIEAIMYQLPELCRFLNELGVRETFARRVVERDIRDSSLTIHGKFIQTEKPRIISSGTIVFLYREREIRPFAASLRMSLNLEKLAKDMLSGGPRPGYMAESGRLLFTDVLNETRFRSELMEVPVALGRLKNHDREISFVLPLPIPNFAMMPHYERGYVDQFTTNEAAAAFVMVSRLFRQRSVFILRNLPNYNPPEATEFLDSPTGLSSGWIAADKRIIGTIKVSQSCTLDHKDKSMHVCINAIEAVEPYLRDRATLSKYEQPLHYEDRDKLPLTLSLFESAKGNRIERICIEYDPETDVLRELSQTSMFRLWNAK